jgi:hypothetical protein
MAILSFIRGLIIFIVLLSNHKFLEAFSQGLSHELCEIPNLRHTLILHPLFVFISANSAERHRHGHTLTQLREIHCWNTPKPLRDRGITAHYHVKLLSQCIPCLFKHS